MNSSRGPLWFGLALVAILVAVGAFYFLAPSQNLNVSLKLETSSANILEGDQFTVSVSFSNDAGLTLKNAAVAIVLPSDVYSIDSPSQRVIQQSIGDVAPGTLSHSDFHLVATGDANTVERIMAKLTYGAPGSSGHFETDSAIDIPIGVPAVGVNISVPASVVSGQNFSITVNYNNNTNHPIQNASLAMQYPPAFTFASASSTLHTNGNNAWSLGTIPANGSGAILITGSLVGSNGVSYPIGANLTEIFSGQTYTIANPSANVQLAASPLTFTIAVDNSQSYIAKTGDGLNYVLTYTNTSNVTFQNIVVSANLTGRMFDFSTLSTNGSFNSLANTVSWNGAEVPQLLSLAPGQSGSVLFQIKTKDAFPIRLPSDKNYTLTVQAKLQSPTVSPGVSANATISVASITTKIGGKIVLDERGYAHGDPAPQGIVNSGPYPPKVNKATEYTIHWFITNYATDADDVTISAYLQSGTTCTGAMRSPSSTTLTCNSSNGLVSWQIPIVPATTGISGRPLEAIFQVQNTPAINQIGQDVPLIGPATLNATDAFTSSTMKASALPLTTALPDDTSFSGQRQVTQ